MSGKEGYSTGKKLYGIVAGLFYIEKKNKFEKLSLPCSRYKPLSWKVDMCQLECLLCAVYAQPIASIFRINFASYNHHGDPEERLIVSASSHFHIVDHLESA